MKIILLRLLTSWTLVFYVSIQQENGNLGTEYEQLSHSYRFRGHES
jgi:hypothetical protein